MRVAIVGKQAPFCGMVTYCRELSAELARRGHEVAFFHLSPGHDDALAIPTLLRVPLYTVPAPSAASDLASKLRRFAPDVVHASYALSPLDFSLPELCARLGLPLVVTFHAAFDNRLSLASGLSGLTYRLYARTLNRASRVVVFSEAQRARLVKLGIAGARVAVVPNGVDTARYSPGPSRFRDGLDARVLLTYMGRISPEKNVGALLSAFERLGRRDWALAVMGDGYTARSLRNRHAASPNIHFLGFVGDEATRIDVLRGTDAFVLPSRVEGLSLALLEAMACGAAPLATDVGADGEVVAGCGWLLDAQRIGPSLDAALGAIATRPHALAAARERARARVVARYEASRNLEALLGVYADARAAGLPLAR